MRPCLCTYADDVCPFRGPTGRPQCESAVERDDAITRWLTDHDPLHAVFGPAFSGDAAHVESSTDGPETCGACGHPAHAPGDCATFYRAPPAKCMCDGPGTTGG